MYGGSSPTARSMLAITPRIIIGKLMPRSYNGFFVSESSNFQDLPITFSVNINAASAPHSTSQMAPAIDDAFQAGHRLEESELVWLGDMRELTHDISEFVPS